MDKLSLRGKEAVTEAQIADERGKIIGELKQLKKAVYFGQGGDHEYDQGMYQVAQEDQSRIRVLQERLEEIDSVLGSEVKAEK